MYVLIPHPTEELKLIKFQKQLISQLFTNDILCYAESGLWIPFLSGKEDSTQTLKNLSKTITSITINSPVIIEEKIFCPVTITRNQELPTVTTELPLCRILNKKQPSSENPAETELFPLKLKIFRLGLSCQLSDNSKAIQNSVWKKLT